jgi:hypothetical protein
MAATAPFRGAQLGPHLHDRTGGNGDVGDALGAGEGARGGALGMVVA